MFLKAQDVQPVPMQKLDNVCVAWCAIDIAVCKEAIGVESAGSKADGGMGLRSCVDGGAGFGA